MDDWHPFCSMSSDHPIPEIRQFQTLTLKLQGQGHGCDHSAKSYNQPSILLICFLFISHQSDNNSWDTAISKFDLETSKVKVMSEAKGQHHMVYPVSNRCTSFSFHINQTNHFWDMAKIVFDPEKTHPKCLKNFVKITVSIRTFPKSYQVITMTRAIKLPHFVVIGLVVLTSLCRQANFCWYIICPKYLRCSSNSFDMRGNTEGNAEANWKHKVTLDRGDLIMVRKRLNWVLTSVTLTFDLWPWPFAWASLLSSVISHENFMMIQWWNTVKKVWRMDRRTDWTIHRAAWSQLKTIGHLFHATSSFVHHLIATGQFKIELQSRNTKLRWKTAILQNVDHFCSLK